MKTNNEQKMKLTSFIAIGIPGNGFNITGPPGAKGLPGRRGLIGMPGFDAAPGSKGDKGKSHSHLLWNNFVSKPIS